MSLLQPNDHRKGNPNWTKGKAPGRPKGTRNKVRSGNKVADRLEHKHKVHPVDHLVSLALQARLNNELELASDIWLKLLQYMEPTKKPVESAPEKPQTPEQSKEAAEAALKMLEEISNTGDERGNQGSGNTPGLATGAFDVQAQTSSEKDLQKYPGE